MGEQHSIEKRLFQNIADTISLKTHIRTYSTCTEKILIFIIGSIKSPYDYILLLQQYKLSNHSRFPIRGTSFLPPTVVCVYMEKKDTNYVCAAAILDLLKTWCEFNFCSLGDFYFRVRFLSSAYNCAASAGSTLLRWMSTFLRLNLELKRLQINSYKN